MANPEVMVDFTADPLDVPTSFEVLRSRFLEIRRGRAHERAHTAPSHLTVTLPNADRALDPDNADGPHWPHVRPMRHVRAEVTLGATTYPLCAAFADSWNQSWPDKKDAVVPFEATDGLKLLNLAKVAGTRYSHALYTDIVDGLVGATLAHYYMDDAPGASSVVTRIGTWHLDVVGTNVTIGSALRPPTYGRPHSVEFGPNDNAGDGLRRTTLPVMPAMPTGGINILVWACWLRLDSLATDGYVAGFSATNYSLIWRMVGSTATVSWTLLGVPEDRSFANVFIADGEWHHYAVRITIDSGDDMTVIFHRDGESIGSDVSPTANGAPGNLTAPTNFFVGGDGGLGGSHGIDGNMAHLVIITNGAPGTSQMEELGTAVFDHIPEEPAGLQIHSILDGVGWPLDARDIDDGTVDMEAIEFQPGDQILQPMLDIAETSERGLLYVNGAGIITFRDAASLAARTSMATFGDSGAELRYQELQTRHTEDDIVNQVAITYPGGVVYVEDAVSVRDFGPKLLPLTVRLVDTADVEALADAIVAAYKDPHTRPVRLELVATTNTAILEQIFARQQGDRITVLRRPPGGGDPLTLDAIIEGATTRALPGGVWIWTADLAPATAI